MTTTAAIGHRPGIYPQPWQGIKRYTICNLILSHSYLSFIYLLTLFALIMSFCKFCISGKQKTI